MPRQGRIDYPGALHHVMVHGIDDRKLFSSETVGRVADRTLQIFGGAGYMVETGIERLFRDVRVMRIYEGTSQIQQIVIARHMLDRYRQGQMA